MMPFISKVETCSRKTGLSGITGNKGSIVTRFNYLDESFCFISCHLTAGQFYLHERDNELEQILKETLFSHDLKITDHDYIILAGDTNYRIDLDIDATKELIFKKDYDSLLSFDQVRNFKFL